MRRPSNATETGNNRPVTTIAGRAPSHAISTGARIEPSPRPARRMLSITPNTRASTAAGAERWISVIAATSTTVLPAPTPASTANTIRAVGDNPTSEMPTPHTIAPKANQAPSRRLPERPAARMPPMIPPTPKAESRYPTPAFPRSNTSSASTTLNTASAPATIVCTAYTPTTASNARSEASVRIPAVASRKRLSGAGFGHGFGFASGLVHQRDQRRRPQHPRGREHEHRGRPADPSTATPPMPAKKMATPSTVVATAFAAVSCSGVRASVGSSAACAGRKVLVTIAAIDASRHRPTRPVWAETATAIPMISAAAITFEATITRLRG